MKPSGKKELERKDKIIGMTLAILALLIFVLALVISYSSPTGVSEWLSSLNAFKLEGTETQDHKLEAHFLNVGKADCAYIRCGESRILIDSGDRDTSEKVVEYLKAQGVKRLNLVVATHPHRDHIGQMESVIREFEILKFATSDLPDNLVPTSAIYKKMLQALKSKNIHIDNVASGDAFNIGDMKVDILGPCKKYDSLNNNSVVVKMSYRSVSITLMGDAEKSSEADILKKGFNMKSDILKVGHHGSNTSSTLSFLKAVNPSYAVISSAPDKNHLPKDNIVKRIEKLGTKVYRTDIHGNIIFLSDGKDIEVKTEKESA